MPSSLNTYLRGCRDSLPFVLVVVPFGLLFGVSGAEAGLGIAEIMGFTILVIAGASQFAALQLMIEEAPTVIVIATALAVNLRMAMYSAALAPHLRTQPFWQRGFAAYMLTDQSYALSAGAFEQSPAMTPGEKVGYYFGASTLVCGLWCVAAYVGAYAGARIPPEYALDFAVPITFIALLAPMLRTLAHVAAALTSILLTLALAVLPYGTGLIVAALCALVVGAQVELWMERRRARA